MRKKEPLVIKNLFVVNHCPYHGGVAQKNTFPTEHPPLSALDIAPIFLRNWRGWRAFEEENEFLQRDIQENSNNLVQNQEQVTVSSIASIMKTSTTSCCSSKTQISKKAAAVAVGNEFTMRHWINCYLAELAYYKTS